MFVFVILRALEVPRGRHRTSEAKNYTYDGQLELEQRCQILTQCARVHVWLKACVCARANRTGSA
eukprot:6184788-Pleurochrysis_carterae.AAC.3